MLRSSSACRVSTRVVMDGPFANASTPAGLRDRWVGGRLSRGSRNGASRVKSEPTRDDFALSCLNGFPRRLSRRYFLLILYAAGGGDG